MARKAAKDAAKKKAKKQKKMLIVLGVLLVVALVFAVSTLSKLGKQPAAASPGTTTPGSLPTETPVFDVLPGIAAPPAGSLRAFTAFGRKDPFDGGPSQSTPAPVEPRIADAATPAAKGKRNSTRKGG